MNSVILLACIAGFFCGWFSVVSVLLITREKKESIKAKEAEQLVDEETTTAELPPEEKRFLAEMNALINYGMEGGEEFGNKENT